MIGLKTGTVKIVPYFPEWKNLFENEKRALRGHLGHLAVDIQHIGSTAIPGLAAKPIIDLAVGVAQIADAEKCIMPLEEMGFSYVGEVFNGDHFFTKGSEEDITHHLHIVEFNGDHWRNYLSFRDYLRGNQQALHEYGNLKAELATKFPDCRESYTESKSAFIKEIIQKAKVLERQNRALALIPERILHGLSETT